MRSSPLARFRREAQVLAALNHPNIAAIHGIEEADGIHALVLEFVDGPTLADRIERGPIPLDEALLIARQIVDALEAAHEHGIIHRMGTAAYMSPEQAKGKPLDTRTDIWAFGCVLYERLTGRRAFGGEDVGDTLAFIITKEPDWAALPRTLSPAIRRLLRRCLEKRTIGGCCGSSRWMNPLHSR